MMCLGIMVISLCYAHECHNTMRLFLWGYIKDKVSYAKKSSANSTLYEISQPSLHGQCVICIGEQCFVNIAREGGHVEGQGA